MRVLRELRLNKNINNTFKQYFSKGYSEIIDVIPKNYKQTYLEFYETWKDNKLKDNSIINISLISELPLYKLKNYIEENNLNIQIARKLDKVDTLLINHEFITKNYYSNKVDELYYIIPKEFIFENFKQYIDPKMSKENYDHLGYAGDCISITDYVIDGFTLNELITHDNSFNIILKEFQPILGHVLRKFHGNGKAIDLYNTFINLTSTVETHNLNVVFDSIVNTELNQDLIMDSEVFENIFNMLLSTDEGNWELAKEILANCDVETSKPYMIYLYNCFYELRRSTQNINYKFLQNTLKSFKVGYGGKNDIPSINELLPKLINNNLIWAQDYMNCLKIHLNILIKRNIIVEIKAI
jgi:hypothetical protein